MKYLLSMLAALALISTASAAGVTVLTPTIRQGQAIIAALDTKPDAVTFDGKSATAFPYLPAQAGNGTYRVVIPTLRTISLGAHKLCITQSSGVTCHTITISPAFIKLIVLPVPEKMHQTPQQLVASLGTTNAAVAKNVATVSNITLFSSPFGLPLFDNRHISSPFGEVRQTGDPSTGSGQVERITHLGTDFVMPKGSAVAAINSGVVSQAYVDPVYGNSIFVDHGRGIFSLYLHLDTMKVKVGQAVKKGQIIGTLGESGLASAPHLHLSIKINGISVDPIQFVNSFK